MLAAQASERQIAPDVAGHGDNPRIRRRGRGSEVANGDTTGAVGKKFAADRLDRAVQSCGALQALRLAQRVPELDRMYIVRQPDALARSCGAASGLEIIIGHPIAAHDAMHPTRQFNRVSSLS